MSRNSMISNFKYVSYERVCLIIGKIVAIIIIANALGTIGQGSYSLMLTIWNVVAIVGLFGFEVSNNYFGAKIEQGIKLSELLGNTFLFSTAAGALSAAVFVAIYYLTQLFENVDNDLFLIFTAGIVLTILSSSFGRLLFGIGAFKEHFYGVAMHQGLFSIVIISAWLMNFSSVELIGWVWNCSLLIRTFYWATVAFIRAGHKFLASIKTLKMQLLYGIKAYLHPVLNVLNFRINSFIIVYLLGTSSLGVYSIALAATELLLYLPKTLTNLILTEASKEGFVSNISFRLVSTSMLAAVIVVAVFGPIVIPLILPAQFSASIPVVIILLPGTYAMGMAFCGAHYLFGLGDSLTPSISSLVSVIAIIIANFLLIPIWGILGAAAAASIAYITTCVIIFYRLTRIEKVSILYYFRITLKPHKLLRELKG